MTSSGCNVLPSYWVHHVFWYVTVMRQQTVPLLVVACTITLLQSRVAIFTLTLVIFMSFRVYQIINVRSFLWLARIVATQYMISSLPPWMVLLFRLVLLVALLWMFYLFRSLRNIALFASTWIRLQLLEIFTVG